MKRLALFVLFLVFTVNLQGRTYYDLFGTNKKNKLAFANQVIQEVLTPEEYQKKIRLQELVQDEGNSIGIIDLVKKQNNEKKEIFYKLEIIDNEKKPKSQSELLKICRRGAVRFINHNLGKIGKKGENFQFEIVLEKPKDIIYVGKATVEGLEGFFVVNAARYIRVGDWSLLISFDIFTTNYSEEDKNNLVSQLQNVHSVNFWIEKSRAKGL